MKKRFTDNQIIQILKEAETGIPVAELCRKHGMSDASSYKWRAKYSGMDASLMRRMKELEEENRRLKKCTLKKNSKQRSLLRQLKKMYCPPLARKSLFVLT